MKRYTMGIVALILMLGMVMLAGCGSKEAAPLNTETIKSRLLDKKWTCQKMVEREVRSETKPYIEFKADGTVVGNGGCNDFRGQYTLDAEEISFGPLASTRKACMGALGELEFSFHTLLSKVDRLQVEDDELLLFIGNNPVPMVFTVDDGGLW